MKKFYKEVAVEQIEVGYAITLDGKTIKTPAGSLLAVPNRVLADLIASEWNMIEDGGDIIPKAMEYMQLASTAIDKVIPNMIEVSHNVVGYAMNDLLCYRCGDNPELRMIEDKAWNKWTKWAKEVAGMDMQIADGIVPVNQTPAVKANAMIHLAEFDGFKLTVMADLTAIYGSYVLGLAVMREEISIMKAYEISRTDELYQIEKWGVDSEAEKSANDIKESLKKTEKFLKVL